MARLGTGTPSPALSLPRRLSSAPHDGPFPPRVSMRRIRQAGAGADEPAASYNFSRILSWGGLTPRLCGQELI